MNLSDIIRQNVKFVEDSQVTVKVDRPFDQVVISSDTDEDEWVSLQGDDAERFIKEADELYEKAGDVSLQECYEHLAYDYLDLLN